MKVVRLNTVERIAEIDEGSTDPYGSRIDPSTIRKNEGRRSDLKVSWKQARFLALASGIAMVIVAPAETAEASGSTTVRLHAPKTVAGPVGSVVSRALGASARLAEGGGYNVKLPDGQVLHTHGHDAIAGATNGQRVLKSTAPQRRPACVANPATDYHQRVLYGYVAGKKNDSALQIPNIRRVFGQVNYLLNEASVESSATLKNADFLVACDSKGLVDVGVFWSTASDYATVVAAAKKTFKLPHADYTIFFDNPDSRSTICGAANIFGSDRPDASNPNNNPPGAGAGYAVIWGGPLAGSDCWNTTAPLHEIAHNQGAVQASALHSTGPISGGKGGHCFQNLDVMCYDDDRDPRTYPMKNVCSVEKFDCGFDDYFDTLPASGSYLATKWNLGSPANRFIKIVDAPPRVKIEMNYAIPENGVKATVGIRRTGKRTPAFDVQFRTAPGTGASTSDFTDRDQMVHFNSGEYWKTIDVPIIDDLLKEGVEQVALSLASPTNGVSLDPTVRAIAIAASDQPPDGYIKLSGYSYAGGNIYNTTGSGQTVSTSARRGTVKTFFVSIQNDGQVANSFWVKLTISSGTSILVDGSSSKAYALRGADGLLVGPIAPGGAVSLRIDFKMGSYASGSEQFTVLGTWRGDRAVRDLVKGIVRVV